MPADYIMRSVKLPRKAHAAIETAARAKHKSVHAWMRDLILEAAEGAGTAESTPAVEVFTAAAKALGSLDVEDRRRVLDGLGAFFHPTSQQKEAIER